MTHDPKQIQSWAKTALHKKRPVYAGHVLNTKADGTAEILVSYTLADVPGKTLQVSVPAEDPKAAKPPAEPPTAPKLPGGSEE